MDLMKENKQLKSMLLLHLNVIQEQTDMLVAKDKQIASLQAKLDRLERKMLGVAAADENVNTNANAVPAAGLSRPATGAQLTRMKMATLNHGPGKSPVRVRPLTISLKKVVVDSSQPNNNSSKTSNGFAGSATKMINKTDPHTLIRSDPVNVKVGPQTPPPSSLEYNSPPPSVEENVPRCEGSEDSSVPDKETKSSEESEERDGGLFRFNCKDIYPSDGSPHDIPIELKFEDDDLDEEEEEELMEMKLDLSEEAEVVETKASPIKSESPPAPPPVEESPPSPRPSLKMILPSLTSESLAKQQATFENNSTKPTTIKKRSPSECSNRAPRKYSRVMSTRKLYVSRHWEALEDDELEPNSLVVPELKEGESNLEVPKWKEIDARGLDEEVATEDAPQNVVTMEDLSEAAFLKRHAKHEADERRRKKWDIQRLREQRTIEKLKKRHCKSDIYYSLSAVGGGAKLEEAQQQQGGTFPMSLYPGLNNVRHIETTEYLPVQAFGEPIPTLSEGEFVLPWHGGGGGSGAGSVEWIQTGNGAQVGSACSNSGGGLEGANSNSNSNQHSKYSSFYVKQNSSSIISNSSTSRIRFKRVKSQSGGSSCGGGRR